MKASAIWTGVGSVAVVGGVWYFYEKSKAGKPPTAGAFFNTKGYTSLMKLSPNYYNNTSTEGASQAVANNNSAEPWTVAANTGNGEQLMGAWTDSPDTYSATVSNQWLQGEAQGAHL